MTHGFFEIMFMEFDKKCGLYDHKYDSICIRSYENRQVFHNIKIESLGAPINIFFIEFHKHNSKKPMGHLSLCLLESTPLFYAY